MQIIETYRPVVEKWAAKPFNRIPGTFKDHLNFGFSFKNPDPHRSAYAYLSISTTIKTMKEDGDVVFEFRLETTFRILNNGQIPAPESLYELLKLSLIYCGQTMEERGGHNSRPFKSIQPPVFREIYAELLEASLILRSQLH